MPSTNVQVPSMGESINEATLVKWHKNDGDPVAVDEPIAELETDKANVDIPSSTAGVLKRVVSEGTKVRIGDTIATVDPNGTPSAAKAQATPKAQSSGVPTSAGMSAKEAKEEKLSPAAKRMVEEHKLDPTKITATGPGSRITKEDVVNHMDGAKTPTVQAPPSPPATQRISTPQPQGTDPVRRVKMTPIRKRIAETLVKSQQTTASLTTFNEIDLSAVSDLRKKYKEVFEKAHGVGLGFMSFFARAVCVALRDWPAVNASIDGEEIVYHDYVHLGIAVSTDRGLTVPVLRNADKMSFAQLESEIKRVAGAVREGKLGLNELAGATFTITNGGVFGSLLATPILNPPQSGILGMHAIKERPVAVNGQVVVRPMMFVALTYDHRIIDGRESVSFLVRVKELLEDPQRLLLEV